MTEHPLLRQLARFGIHLGLDRMRGFLASLGSPELRFPAVHVAGTNGKFSVTRMVASVLRAEGYKVGVTISPHLQQVNERMSIDGEDIGDEELDGLLQDVDLARRAWAREQGELHEENVLTYFEVVTAAAFLWFARKKVDVAVVEVGLGGRLDATNVLDGVVSAIVSIGLDHTEKLGPDLASIAAEKAGVFKPGRPAVIGPLLPAPLRVVRAIANERGTPLIEPGEGYRVKGRNHAFTFSCGGTVLKDLSIPLLGEHQLENAGVALAALHHLPPELAVSERAIREGLAEVSVPGRIEWLAPDLLLDAAHNADGAARLADFLRELPRDRPRYLLLGMSSDKDARAVAASLKSCVDRIFTTQCAHPRACSAGELAEQLVAVGIPVLPAGPIEEALPAVRDGEALIIVAGSVFLAGAVRDIVAAL